MQKHIKALMLLLFTCLLLSWGQECRAAKGKGPVVEKPPIMKEETDRKPEMKYREKTKDQEVFDIIYKASKDMDAGRYQEAYEGFLKSLEFFETSTAYFGLGICCSIMGDQETDKNNPINARKRYDEALSFFFKSLSLTQGILINPPNEKARRFHEDLKVNIYNNIGLNYDRLMKYDDALIYFRYAEELGNEKAVLNIALVYRLTGRLDDAIDKYEEYLKRFPNSSIADKVRKEAEELRMVSASEKAYDEGYRSMESGDFITAEKKLKEAVRLSPEPSHRIYYYLGMILFYRNKYDEALVYLQKALDITIERDLENTMGAILNSMGMVHMKMDNSKRAERCFYQAMQLGIEGSPHRRSSEYNMGMLFLRMGYKEEAIKIFEYVLKNYPCSGVADDAKAQLKKLGIDPEEVKNKIIELPTFVSPGFYSVE